MNSRLILRNLKRLAPLKVIPQISKQVQRKTIMTRAHNIWAGRTQHVPSLLGRQQGWL
jgi:hypothetical protein